VFSDANLTAALVDRLAHKAHVLDMSGEWIGNPYLDGITKPFLRNPTGVIYPRVECTLMLLNQCT